MKAKWLIWIISITLGMFSAIAEQAADPSAEPTLVPRRILVLFGRDPKVNEGLRLNPVDTLTASTLQAHLEWLGYEVDYFDAGHADPPSPSAEVAGIIMDGTLQIDPDRELGLADWMNTQRLRKIPFLLIGDLPVFHSAAINRLQQDFGLIGDFRPIRNLKSVEITTFAPDFFTREIKIEPREKDFQSVIAPQGSEVFLTLTGKDDTGGLHRFDPVFRAPWGVVWLGPYVTFEAAASQRFYYADPYALIHAWLGDISFPAPDVTTRMGRRLFFSHIDGDGFASRSSRPGQPTCAELIRDRILRRYPFPVTVSVIEADIRGHAAGLRPEDAPLYEDIARSIFSLPNVEPASHSYSHPFLWDETDANPGVYPHRFVPLHPAANYTELSLQREIVASVKFINERLVPPGRKVGLMLWSGNCRPGAQALAVTRQLGIENMNGGDTTVSEMYPSLINIAPKVMPWGNELQVYAANQNEFMYSAGFSGPFYGGFGKVVQTFEHTGTPRRFKPVNVYYHFYSAATISAERALKKVLDWCWAEPLHYISASEYVKTVRDSRAATIQRIASGHWKLKAGPQMQTWRLPATFGVPNLETSKGILGYRQTGDQIYIHTDARPEVELILTPPQQRQTLTRLHIAESSGPIEVTKSERREISIINRSPLAAKVLLGGLGPDETMEVIYTRGTTTETRTLKPDKTGLLLLEGHTADVRATAGQGK